MDLLARTLLKRESLISAGWLVGSWVFAGGSWYQWQRDRFGARPLKLVVVASDQVVKAELTGAKNAQREEHKNIVERDLIAILSCTKAIVPMHGKKANSHMVKKSEAKEAGSETHNKEKLESRELDKFVTYAK